MQKAKELFFDTYDDPKAFYESFTTPADLYLRLARTAVTETVTVTVWVKESPKSPGSITSKIEEAAHKGQDAALEPIVYETMYTALSADATDNRHAALDELIAMHQNASRTD